MKQLYGDAPSSAQTRYRLDPDVAQKAAAYAGLLSALGYPIRAAAPYGGVDTPAIQVAKTYQDTIGSLSSVQTHGSGPEGGVQGEDLRRRLGSPFNTPARQRRAWVRSHLHQRLDSTFPARFGTPEAIRLWNVAPRHSWAQSSALHWAPANGKTFTTQIQEGVLNHLLEALVKAHAELQASVGVDSSLWDQLADVAANIFGGPELSEFSLGFEDEAPILAVPVQRRIREGRLIRRGRRRASLAISEGEIQRMSEE